MRNLITKFPKIIGGEEVHDSEDHTFMASLQSPKGKHFCGGMVIDRNKILTAAHCVDSITPEYIQIGALNIDNETDGFYVTPEKVHIHPRYDVGDAFLEYDFAIIETTPMATTPNIIAVGSPSDISVNMTALGWGITNNLSSETSNKLLKVTLPHVDVNWCFAAYGHHFNSDVHFCAGAVGKDTAGGDSGGPIISSNGKVVGVTSWGGTPGEEGVYGVYAKIDSSVHEFIQNPMTSADDVHQAIQEIENIEMKTTYNTYNYISRNSIGIWGILLIFLLVLFFLKKK